jgi:hypothetical protein
MLQSIDLDSQHCIVGWLPCGKAFAVLNEERFVEEVIPKYFNQTKMRSFTRQLSIWGFKRVVSGADRGSWYHENFVRGDSSRIRCLKRSGAKAVSRSGTVLKAISQATGSTNMSNINMQAPAIYSMNGGALYHPHVRQNFDNRLGNGQLFSAATAAVNQGDRSLAVESKREASASPKQYNVDAMKKLLSSLLTPNQDNDIQTDMVATAPPPRDECIDIKPDFELSKFARRVSVADDECWDELPSLGISGHPCVEKDVERVTDVEVNEFTALYFP